MKKEKISSREENNRHKMKATVVDNMIVLVFDASWQPCAFAKTLGRRNQYKRPVKKTHTHMHLTTSNHGKRTNCKSVSTRSIHRTNTTKQTHKRTNCEANSDNYS